MMLKSAELDVIEVEPGVTRQVLGCDDQLMMVRVTFNKGRVGRLHAPAREDLLPGN